MTKETKDFLLSLINRELKEEYKYQEESKILLGYYEDDYLKSLIKAKRELLGKNFVSELEIVDDIKEYIESLRSRRIKEWKIVLINAKEEAVDFPKVYKTFEEAKTVVLKCINQKDLRIFSDNRFYDIANEIEYEIQLVKS